MRVLGTMGTQECWGHECWDGDMPWGGGTRAPWGAPLALGTLQLLVLGGCQLLRVVLGGWPRPLEETSLEGGHGDTLAPGGPHSIIPGDPMTSPLGTPLHHPS